MLKVHDFSCVPFQYKFFAMCALRRLGFKNFLERTVYRHIVPMETSIILTGVIYWEVLLCFWIIKLNFMQVWHNVVKVELN